MGLDFDVAAFCRNLRASKPPFECPVNGCGKIYKSIIGLQYHLFNYDHDNPQTPATPSVSNASTPISQHLKHSKNRKKGRASFHNSANSSPDKNALPEGLTYAEAQKLVEFDIGGGRSQRYSIFEPFEVLSLEDYQASVPGTNVDDILKPVEPGKRAQIQPEETSIRPYNQVATKLPEPSFRVMDDYEISDAPPLPNSYIRFIEKSVEELDAEVEYDADEEDEAWLEIANEKREKEGLPPVSEENFELLMDRLEKECYFQMASTGQESGALIDDDAVCCICMDGECQNSNVILFCDMCNLAVHQDCYGVPYIPEGQWLCRRCLQSPSRAVDCVLCPNNGGAFKQTDRSTWAHVVCALWIPEVRFANTVFLEPIDSIETIPAARWKLTCYICKQKGVGACIQCHKSNCYAAFHVTCAQQAGLHMKMETVRDSGATTGEPAVLVQKTAYCDTHTPADAETRPRIRDKEITKDDSKEKMKKARKILAKKRSSVPVISIPTIPPERIQEIASLVQIARRNQFIQRLIAYWTLKRQHRHGVPLLRRLQTSHPSRRPAETPAIPDSEVDTTSVYQQLKYWQSLRQDLERARLLCELVRKREKLKKEFTKVKESALMLELRPFLSFLSNVLDQIQSKDTGEIFFEPVNQEEVPDYSTVVTHPMDLSTMREKLENYEYRDIDAFEADFQLMINNCLAYNAKDTVFYRTAIRMRDQGGAILRQARRDFADIGFDLETGLLLEKKPESSNPVTDDQIFAEIDSFFNSDDRKDKLLDLQLTILLNLSDKCQKIKHVTSRSKRLKQIKTEISNVRRKIALEQSSSSSKKRSSKKKEDATHKSSADENGSDGSSTGEVASSDSSSGSDDSSSDGSDSNSEDSDSDNSEKTGRAYKTRLAVAPPAEPVRMRRPRAAKQASAPIRDDSPIESPEKTPKRIQRRRSTAKKEEVEELPVLRRQSVEQQKINKEETPTKDASTSAPAFTPESQVTPQKKILTSTSQQTTGSPSLTGSSPSGVNRRTAVLFTRKAAAAFRKPETPPSSAKRRVGRPRKSTDSIINLNPPDLLTDGKSSSVPSSESFRVYRSGGEIAAETDEETDDDSDKSADNSDSGSTTTSGESGDESDSSETAGPSSYDKNAALSDSSDDGSGPLGEGNFDPLELVWAKCRGYPWYPALIIDPNMKEGFINNGVPIPAPPTDVLALATNYTDPVYLVLFFDTKRTWQWLPRNKIDVFYGEAEKDQDKLCESRKPAERKAVRKAYQEASLYRRQVSGELQLITSSANLSSPDTDE